MAGWRGGIEENRMDEREQLHQQQAGCSTIAAECEAFLYGTLAEYWDDKGICVPVWAWLNLLAHGTETQVAETALRSGRHRRTARSWRIARSYLAYEVLDLLDAEFTLADMQASVLIPLELEMAARPEVTRWSPRQWVQRVDTAIRTEASTLEC